MHIFPVVSRQSFWQIVSNSMYGEFKIIGTHRAGKCALTSHSGFSVMDKIKINEQNKSIVTGPLYEQAEFEAILNSPT